MLKYFGRKAILAIGTFLMPFIVSSIALFVNRLTGEQWIDLIQWLVPSVLMIYNISNVTQKIGTKKEEKTDK
ncbi:hypothetical protein HYV49_01090 [Candidatus Pacearchaeota archaeon]|nr:hypothetical protein [Candidatus Pacearchaeota archaeon]